MILLIARRDECDLIFQEAITFMLCLAPIASKAGQQLLCKAPLFAFLLAFSFTFLSLCCSFFASLFSQEKRGTSTKSNDADRRFLLSLTNQMKIVIGQSRTENTKATHDARYQKKQLYPNRTLVYIHRHTRKTETNKTTLIVTGGCFLYGQILHV